MLSKIVSDTEKVDFTYIVWILRNFATFYYLLLISSKTMTPSEILITSQCSNS